MAAPPTAAPPAVASRPSRRGDVGAALLVAGITLLVFLPVVGHDYLDWDDRSTVQQNPNLNPPTLEGLAHYWRQFNPHEEFYVPVNYTAWWLLAHVARITDASGNVVLNPAVFHAFNLLVHAFNGVLVYVVLRRFVPWRPAAALGALLFALHPVQVEPVAWVSSMYSELSAMFCLLATWQFLKFSDARAAPGAPVDPTEVRPRSAWKHYALATLAFLIALYTKPNVVTVPLVIGVIEWGLRRRRVRDLVLPLGAWLALAAPVVLLARASQADAQVQSVPAAWKPLVALDSLSFYLRQLVLPVSLGPDYGRSPQWLLTGLRQQLYVTWVLPVALLAGCAVAWARRGARWPLACALVLVAAVLPTLGLVPFDYQRYSTVADRYLYFAMLGPALALALLLARYPRRGAAAVVVAALAVRSHVQTYHWRDTQSLFSHALAVNPRSLAAHSVFGYRYASAGNDELAMREYGLALEANPGDPRVLFNVGNLMLRRGRFADAEAAYRGAIPHMRRNSTLYSNMGVALAQLGRPDEALASLRRAVEINPENADAHANLGVVLASRGEADAARTHFETALRLAPDSAVARRGLARLQGPKE